MPPGSFYDLRSTASGFGLKLVVCAPLPVPYIKALVLLGAPDNDDTKAVLGCQISIAEVLLTILGATFILILSAGWEMRGDRRHAVK